MVVVQINQTNKIGSTGKIMADLNDVITKHGHEGYMVAGYTLDDKVDSLYSLNEGNYAFAIRKNILISRISGKMGYRQEKETIKAIEWIDSKNPDVIHLHNIHGDWINIQLLFEYIKKKKIPVVWTLHDCWAFTGRCSHFELNGCEQWKYGCKKCSKVQKKIYPITYFFDYSEKMWKDKKEIFTSIEKCIIVTPSKWLANYVQKSFMGKYPITVINNGINLDVFYFSNSPKKFTKKILLGVATSWSDRKGLCDFLKLNKMIDHERYQICLVGLNDRQYKDLPNSIIKIKRTNNIAELRDLYSEAVVFINPTYQDNYPTVNLEALACGTKVVTYNTGGSPESVDECFGLVVPKGDVKTLFLSAMGIAEQVYDKRLISENARKKFDMNKKYDEYLDIYHQLCGVDE